MEWWKKSVVYQIYPKSFMDSNGDGVGDIQGIISRLSYLKKLGVEVIWLSPVYQSPMKDNGYDISDYRKIAREFGSLEDMDQLLEEASKLDIGIIMDLVVNHTSDQHPWFLESREDPKSPYRDYYIWNDAPGDMESIFGGSAWSFDQVANQYYFHLFTKEQPDLNWSNEDMRRAVYDMMNWWIERGVKGFRLDVIDLIGKDLERGITANGPKLHDYLKEMNRASFGRHQLLTVGETWSASPEMAIKYTDPKEEELSMVFQFEHMVLDWDKDLGKWKPHEFSLLALKKIIGKWQKTLYNRGWNSLFWNNHDLPRIVSRWGNDKEYRVESAKLFATILHGLQGTPYIYQGEEIGMTNVRYDRLADYDDVETHGMYEELVTKKGILSHEDFMKGLYQSGRDNARTPMQWSSDQQAGFTTGEPWLQVNPNYKEINVEAALADQDSIFYHYQRLILLRKEKPYDQILIKGSYEDLSAEDKNLYVYKRSYKGEQLLIVGNFTPEDQPFSPPVGKCVLVSGHGHQEYLSPYESRIYYSK